MGIKATDHARQAVASRPPADAPKAPAQPAPMPSPQATPPDGDWLSKALDLSYRRSLIEKIEAQEKEQQRKPLDPQIEEAILQLSGITPPRPPREMRDSITGQRLPDPGPRLMFAQPPWPARPA
jgi:hypothetical protein